LPGYASAYASVSALFESNERFRIDVLDKGYAVLGAKLGREAVTYDAAREGVEYLLKEFAYFTLFRSAFGRDVVVPYHQDFTLGQRFCDGGYDAPLPGIGWLIYDIDVPGDDRSEKGA
jgi:tRNA-dependent cyclodipeptide synthase